MQPKLCSRCHKNVAVVFITKLENNEQINEGLCLKCAREMGIKPVQDMMEKMGISEEDLEELTGEMMNAFGGPEALEELVSAADSDEGEDDDIEYIDEEEIEDIDDLDDFEYVEEDAE